MPRPAPPPIPRPDWRSFNTASLVTGIMAFVLPVVGIPLAILALGLGYHARRRAAPHRPPRTGIVLGTIALVLQVPAIVGVVGMAMGDIELNFPESAQVQARTAPAIEYSNPLLAQSVLARGAPAPVPPPADTAPDALETETEIPGQGLRAAAGDTLIINYLATVPDGTVVNDTWPSPTPVTVVLPPAGEMNGWERALVGAAPGERRRVVLGSENAAGEAGGGGIPPNSPLGLTVDVLDVQRASSPATVPASTVPG